MSPRPSLAETLLALAEGVMPAHPLLAVEEAEIALPLIVRFEAGTDGPRFTAQPPYSAFHSGFEPVHHRARIRFGELCDPVRVPAAGPHLPSQEPGG